MTSVLCVERQATLVATALMCSVTTAKNSATFPKTALTNSLHWEHFTTTTGHIPGHMLQAQPVGTDCTVPLTTKHNHGETLSTGHGHITCSNCGRSSSNYLKACTQLPISQPQQQFMLPFGWLMPQATLLPGTMPHWCNCNSSRTVHYFFTVRVNF